MLNSRAVICLAAAVLILISPVPAASQLTGTDTAPGDSCAGIAAGATRLNADPDQDGAQVVLVCDGTTWNAMGVKVTYDGAACTSAEGGTIRFVSGGDPPWEYCDGGTTSWLPFKQPRCQDDDTGECFSDATRANDDPDFTAANIADGINILGVTGTLPAGGLSEAGTISNANLDTANGVAVAGDYAYVASLAADSLTIIDISNPASPSQVGTISNANLDGAFSVAVAGDYAYVVSNIADSLTIIDISNPASPSQVGAISNVNLDGADDVAVAGDYAYVTSFDADSLTIIDISNPASPSQVGTISNSFSLNGAQGVAVAGDYAYVACRFADRLTVIDISNPASPSQVGTITSVNLDVAWDVAVAGDYAYVAASGADSLTVIDISNPASPSQVGTISNATDLDVAEGIAVAGDYAYVASRFSDSLTIIDISNPASPSLVDTISNANLARARDISVAGDYAYVASLTADSLTIIDLGDYKVAEYGDCTADSTDTCVLDQNRSKYDTDFKPQNIADGVNVLRVTGTLSAGGGLTGPAGCANIGDLCADGTVFAGYHPITQEHLFIPTTDQGTFPQWKTSSGANDIATDSIYDGRINTNQVPNSTTFPAFKLCKDLTTGGHNDWYLPSRVELYYLWAVQETIEAGGNITNFEIFDYWSSSEHDPSGAAFYQTFGEGLNPDGIQFIWSKDSPQRVRCIRR